MIVATCEHGVDTAGSIDLVDARKRLEMPEDLPQEVAARLDMYDFMSDCLKRGLTLRYETIGNPPLKMCKECRDA